MQTAVTAYFSSKQLLLFVFADIWYNTQTDRSILFDRRILEPHTDAGYSVCLIIYDVV